MMLICPTIPTIFSSLRVLLKIPQGGGEDKGVEFRSQVSIIICHFGISPNSLFSVLKWNIFLSLGI